MPGIPIEALLDRRSDLSTFIVHLTRDTEGSKARDNLWSILNTFTIKARTPRGWIDGVPEAQKDSAKVVCFSETPLEHVYSMCQDIQNRSIRLQPYGVAFTKDVARSKGVNPVWYVDETPGRDWEIANALNALRDSAIATGDFAAHPAAKVMPFIEAMGDWRSAGKTRREFSWEREWRHQGDFRFAWPDAIVLCPEHEFDVFSRIKIDTLEYTFAVIDPTWSLERMIAHLARRR